MTDIKKLSALFDKLGTDDGFRARMQTDPAGALKEVGINVPKGMSTSGIQLPSKEDVQAKKAEWLQHASAEPTAMAVFFFIK
jgi:putative modified peptide